MNERATVGCALFLILVASIFDAKRKELKDNHKKHSNMNRHIKKIALY